MLIRGNRIVCVGSSSQVYSSMGTGCEVLDMDQNIVYPGFVDAHCHVKGVGQAQEIMRLDDVTSLEEGVALVKNQAKLQDKGSWVLGRNWDQERWDISDMPDKMLLDSEVKYNPVWLTRVDAHAGLANSMAIDIAKTLNDSNFDSVRAKVSQQSLSTGLFVDEEMEFIRNALPPQSVQDVKRMILTSQDLLLRSGLTEVHDAGIGPVEYEAYLELARENKLKIRIYAMQNRNFVENYGIKKIEVGLFTSSSIKVIYDGALGSRGASLLSEYQDDPGNFGTTLHADEELLQIMHNALQASAQINIHAIGDGANRKVLDTLELALEGKELLDHRTRVEHAQHVQKDDVERFQKLKVIASVQPMHYKADISMAKKRLGSKRLHNSYLWKTFIEHGVRLIYGSDSPVVTFDPILGIESALLREGLGEEDALYARERLTAAECLRAMTLDAAYSRFGEGDKGEISPGMLADLTILDRDIRLSESLTVAESEVVGTIVDGKLVYLRQ